MWVFDGSLSQSDEVTQVGEVVDYEVVVRAADESSPPRSFDLVDVYCVDSGCCRERGGDLSILCAGWFCEGISLGAPEVRLYPWSGDGDCQSHGAAVA